MNETLEPDLLMAFAPVDKRALGFAVGVALGLAIGLLTVVSLILIPREHQHIGLLAQFFVGYSVTWTGAVIGAAWGLFIGFVAGWFIAFTRNLALAIWMFVVQTRAELSATRDFLDHI